MRITRTLVPATIVLLAAACASGGGDTAADAPTPESATPAPEPAAAPAASGGMYTEAQAEEGRLLFRDFCSACHSSSEFQGAGFLGSWGGRTAYDLHGFISQNMPEDAPGMLSGQEYADIVAYVFQLNGFPAGGDPLTSDEARLRLARIPSGQ